MSESLTPILYSGFQDIIVSLSIVWLFFALLQMPRFIPPSVGALVLTIVFFFNQFVFLCDFFLYRAFRVKFSLSFLHFFLNASSFWSSAKQNGGPMFLYMTGVLLLLSIFVFRSFIYLLRQHIKRKTAMVVFAAISLFFIVGFIIPITEFSDIENPIYCDLAKSIKPILQKNANSQITPVDRIVLPRNEEYYTIDKDYPLYRFTSGFTGDSYFDIQIKEHEKPHVIFLFMESFRAADIHSISGQHNVSPNFDKLADSGILFTRFYANGVQTTRGALAALYGIHPRISSQAVQADYNSISLIGLPHLFSGQGYLTSFIHNGSLEFEIKDKFFPAHGFQEIYGQNDIIKSLTKLRNDDNSWGVHDEFLMTYAADYLKQKDQEGLPVFLTMFTISNHHPWVVPPWYNAPEIMIPDNPEYSDYLKSFSYSDYCLGLLIDRLKHYGLLHKTILFILADTAQPMGGHDKNFLELKGLYEENIHIPLLIYAYGRIKQPEKLSIIGSQIDLMPTVMDIFSLTGLNHSEGRSLRRQIEEERVAVTSSSFFNRYISVIGAKYKLIYTDTTNKKELYDLISDPLEQTSLPLNDYPEAERYMKYIGNIFISHMDYLYPKNKFCPKLSLGRNNMTQKPEP